MLKESEEIISDIVTCLCSYKTALRIRSGASGIPDPSDEFADLIDISFRGDLTIEFEPEPLERSESDLFHAWRRWTEGNKGAGGGTSSRGATGLVPDIRVTSYKAADSRDAIVTTTSAGTFHDDSPSGIVLSGDCGYMSSRSI